VSHPLDDTGPLPFAPGESPFRIKGTVYRGHLEWVAENAPGGLEGVNRAYRDPRLAPYMSQQFLPSSWYDLLPVVTSAYVVARVCHLGFDEFLRMRTRIQAQRDLGGVYKLLLKLTSPANVVNRYAAVQQQYFSFGTATAELIAPRTARVQRGQIPQMVFDWMAPVQEAFLEQAIAAAGGKQVRAVTKPAIPDGESAGVPTVTLVSDASWK
jgi:hypothetical protein